MAFVSMMFVALVIAAVILGGMLLIGLVLLIVGIVGRRKPQNKGKRFPTACIVAGGVMLGVPVILAAALVVESVIAVVRTTTERTEYEFVPDRWRNEWVTDDNEAAQEAVNALLLAADKGDRDGFAGNFTPALQQSEGFDEALDAFFAAYPGHLSLCELEGGVYVGGGSYDAGHVVKESSADYQCRLNGEWYRIYISFCYRNTDEPDEVGVRYFTLMNLGAAAVFDDGASRDPHYGDGVYLLCDIRSAEEVDARLIDGQPFLWIETGSTVFTAEEMRDILAGHERLDDPEVSGKIGAANVLEKRYNNTAYHYYYELASENGEPRYAYFTTDSPFGKILSAYVCTPDETDYDKPLWEEEN